MSWSFFTLVTSSFLLKCVISYDYSKSFIWMLLNIVRRSGNNFHISLCNDKTRLTGE